MRLTPLSTRMVAASVAAAALVAAGSLIGSNDPAEGAPTGTLTFKELEKGSTFTHIRNTSKRNPQSNRQGDVLAMTSPLVDGAGKRIGKLHTSCVTTVGARDFKKSTVTCGSVVSLRDGTLTAQFILKPSSDTVRGAITGGTGAYANARGVVVSRSTRGGVDDTITFDG